MKRTIRWRVAGAVLVAGVAMWWLGGGPATEAEAPKTQAEPGSAASGSEFDDALGSLEQALSTLEGTLLSIDEKRESAVDGAEQAGVPSPELPTGVEALKERYEASGNPQERVAVMREFALRLPLYAREASGGHSTYLDFLRKVAAGGAADERRHAIIAVHGIAGEDVVAFLDEHTRSRFPEVRFYAAEGLAWSARAGTPGAAGALLRTLQHDDPRVRGIVALSLGTVVRDHRLTPHMVARLREEREFRVIESLVRSVIQISGDDGRRRIEEDVVPVVGPDAKASIEQTLANLRRANAK